MANSIIISHKIPSNLDSHFIFMRMQHQINKSNCDSAKSTNVEDKDLKALVTFSKNTTLSCSLTFACPRSVVYITNEGVDSFLLVASISFLMKKNPII